MIRIPIAILIAAAVELTPSPSKNDTVVATVDGRPIFASAVALQAAAKPSSAKEALDDLISAEALVSEAKRRGLDQSSEVVEAGKVALAYALLQTFEKEVTKAQLDGASIRRAYDRFKPELDHSRQIDVWHILVPLKKDALPSEIDSARKIADEVERRARELTDLQSFQSIAVNLRDASGAPLHCEEITTERDGWTLTSFSHPAFDQLKNPGDVSTVIRTDYGFHVLYLVGYIEPRHLSLKDAEPLLRERLFPSFQRREFARFIEQLSTAHAVRTFPERLSE